MSSYSRLSVKNSAGVALPVMASASAFPMSDEAFDDVMAGVVYVQPGMHGDELLGALSMLECIPSDIQKLILVEPANEESTSLRMKEERLVAEARIEKMVSEGLARVIYDMNGKHDALFPPSTFRSFQEVEGRGPHKTRFAGDLDQVAKDAAKAAEIRHLVLDEAKLNLVRHILTDRISIRSKDTLVSAKLIFDCMLVGKAHFPLDEGDISGYVDAARTPYIDVFFDIEMNAPQDEEMLLRVNQADEWFMSSLRLWNFALARFECPLTLQEWRIFRENEHAWNFENMKALGELIGVDMYIDTMLAGVPVKDIIA